MKEVYCSNVGVKAGTENCNYCIIRKSCGALKEAKRLAEKEKENEINEFLERINNGEDTRPDDINASYPLPLPDVKKFKWKNQNIYYIVRLKEAYRQELCLTTITKDFCGRIVNQTAGNIYFELNGSNALVIVPHNWIEWLAPSKKLWNLKKGES